MKGGQMGSEMEEALQVHADNENELIAQLDDHGEKTILIVDSDDNRNKYIMTDVRFDGENIVVAITRL
jgi:hypothetical protein